MSNSIGSPFCVYWCGLIFRGVFPADVMHSLTGLDDVMLAFGAQGKELFEAGPSILCVEGVFSHHAKARPSPGIWREFLRAAKTILVIYIPMRIVGEAYRAIDVGGILES